MAFVTLSLFIILVLAAGAEVRLRKPEYRPFPSHETTQDISENLPITELYRLNTLFNIQYQRNADMLTIEQRIANKFLNDASNRTVRTVDKFSARLRRQLVKAETQLAQTNDDYDANNKNRTSCLDRQAAERVHILNDAELAERRCARLDAELLQRIQQRSTFYQLVRMQRKESIGTKTFVLRTLGERNSNSSTAETGRQLRRTAEWQLQMWAKSVESLQREHVRIEQQIGRGAIAMGLCERAVDVEFKQQLAVNIQRSNVECARL